MATLTAYINQLDRFQKNLNKTIFRLVKNEEDKILDITIRRRLEDTGIDGAGNLIWGGQYAPETIEYKKKKNAEYGHFTLKDTGSFYDKMEIIKQEPLMFVRSNDGKASMLINTYGAEILQMNEKETNFIVQWIIEPGLQKIIDGFHQQIDL